MIRFISDFGVNFFFFGIHMAEIAAGLQLQISPESRLRAVLSLI